MLKVFKKSKEEFVERELRKGDLVALHNIFPPESASDIGVIEEIKDDPLGFSYGVREFYDNKLYFHHSSTIIPFEPKKIQWK